MGFVVILGLVICVFAPVWVVVCFDLWFGGAFVDYVASGCWWRCGLLEQACC